MKKSFSLVEVLVAVSLISTVIVAIIKMQQNNLFFIEKFKNTANQNGYISLVVSNSKNLRNKNIKLGDKVTLDDDDIRKEFKDIKIKVKDENTKDMELPVNDYLVGKVIKSVYTLDNIHKVFYKFSLIEKGTNSE